MQRHVDAYCYASAALSSGGSRRVQAAAVYTTEGCWGHEFPEGTTVQFGRSKLCRLRWQFSCTSCKLSFMLQSQLRSQVLSKLQKQDCSVHAAVPGSEALWGNVMNSLIVDYLSACHYHYTLSVFQPEAGLSGLQGLTPADILQMLQVGPGSPLQLALDNKAGANAAEGMLLCRACA